ncbi:hypothetical protein ACSBM8_02895 [Sphingomonas sp. ASY06-1R]|uniref:hypothetical protein n=1 Tax=Sphingomonas sp. ASY06-1R TaxID=3445771 RepID=UPI003FA1C4EA
MSFQEPDAAHRPPVPYYLSFAAAMLGIVAIAIAIDGSRRAMSGGDPRDAFNGAGAPAIICVTLIMYYQRLMRWEKVSADRQAFVRRSVRLVLVAEVVAAILATWLVFSSGAAAASLHGIVVIGDILQIGTILWVVRYCDS